MKFLCDYHVTCRELSTRKNEIYKGENFENMLLRQGTRIKMYGVDEFIDKNPIVAIYSLLMNSRQITESP